VWLNEPHSSEGSGIYLEGLLILAHVEDRVSPPKTAVVPNSHVCNMMQRLWPWAPTACLQERLRRLKAGASTLIGTVFGIVSVIGAVNIQNERSIITHYNFTWTFPSPSGLLLDLSEIAVR
jgi:hypothetical protein